MRYQNFNAFKSIEHIRENLVRYLLDIFNIKDDKLQDLVEQIWKNQPEDGGIISRPLFENNFTYETGKKTLKGIVKDLSIGSGLSAHLDYLENVKSNFGLIENWKEKEKANENIRLFYNHEELRKKFHQFIIDNYFPSDRMLYSHQEQAICKSIHDNKDIIVSAGTGSGKSECFILPSLMRLFNEPDESLNQPGVRVIIIYPMNALINSQMKRLQYWLGIQNSDRPQIRFGFYTGRLKEDASRIKLLEREEMLPNNQIINRQELRDNPPHIMVTNYSMLERSLFYAKDAGLFSSKLHTIILDEAHVYYGSKAADIALLLRRLVAASCNDINNIHFFATSATIGKAGEEDALKEFAAHLFSKDKKNIEILRGNRKIPDETVSHEEFSQETLYQLFSKEFMLLIDKTMFVNNENKLIKNSENADKLRNHIKNLNNHLYQKIDKDKNLISNFPGKVLYCILSKFEGIARLRKNFSSTSLFIEEIIELLNFKSKENGEEIAYSILEAVSLAKAEDGQLPLIPIKMHLVVNSPDGLYVCLDEKCSLKKLEPELPFGKVYNLYRKECDCESDKGMGEIVVCKSCGNYFIVYTEENSRTIPVDNYKDISQIKMIFFKDGKKETSESASVCPICGCNHKGDIPLLSDDDTQPEHAENSDLDSEEIEFEGLPNAFFKRISISNLGIQYPLIDYFFETLNPLPLKEGDAVDNLPGQGRRLLTFTDNRQKAASLASRLDYTHSHFMIQKLIYQTIKNAINKTDYSKKIANLDYDNEEEKLRIKSIFENLLQSIDTTGQYDINLITGENQKYFRNTIKPILDEYNQKFVAHSELVNRLENDKSLKQIRLSLENIENHDKEKKQIPNKTLSEILVFKEFSLLPKSAKTLQNLGLVSVEYEGVDSLKFDMENIDNEYREVLVSFKPEDLREMIKYFFDIFRRRGVIEYTFSTTSLPKVQEYLLKSENYYKKSISKQNDNNNDKIFFLRNNAINRETNYFKIVEKYIRKIRRDITEEAANELTFEVLADIWNEFSKLENVLVNTNYQEQNFPRYQLKIDGFRYRINPPLYQCNSCGLISTRNIGGICLKDNCEGELSLLNPDEKNKIYESQSYQRMINTENDFSGILGMVTQEHTAQIQAESLEGFENKFTKGEINVLSSSTTMELGIDIGGLTAVFLSNSPYNTASYQQRAGRAGRRMDGTALILTNAKKLPIDQNFFKNPKHFFETPPLTPQVSLYNRKIVERHLFVHIISHYLIMKKEEIQGIINKRNTESKKSGLRTIDFFITPFSGTDLTFSKDFKNWLETTAINDSNLNKKIDFIKSNTEFKEFENQSIYKDLKKKMDEIDKDFLLQFKKLEQLIEDQVKSNNTKYVDKLKINLNILKNYEMIEYLLNNQLIPKYGFPYNVIQLVTGTEYNNNKEKTEKLERTVSLALYSYAPGCSVIVNKKKYISRGITFNRLGLDFRMEDYQVKNYFICPECKTLNFPDNNENVCETCGYGEPNAEDEWEKNQEGNSLPPVIIEKIIEPKGFAVSYFDKPEFSKSEEPVSTQSNLMAKLEADSEPFEKITTNSDDDKTIMEYRHLSGGKIITIHEGIPNENNAYHGFAICLTCGRTEYEYNYRNRYSDAEYNKHERLRKLVREPRHDSLRPFGNDKSCNAEISRNISLMAQFATDTLQIRLKDAILPNGGDTELFYNTFGKALCLAASQILQIDNREIGYLIGSYKEKESNKSRKEIILFDDTDGGAGYVEQFSKSHEKMIELFKAAFEILECKNPDCKTACFQCLYTTENVNYIKFDREEVLKKLDPHKRSLLTDSYENFIAKYGQGVSDAGYKDDVIETIKDLLKSPIQEITWFFHHLSDEDFSLKGNISEIIRLAEKNQLNFVFDSEKDFLNCEFVKKALSNWINDVRYHGRLKCFINEKHSSSDIVACLKHNNESYTILRNASGKNCNFTIDLSDIWKGEYRLFRYKINHLISECDIHSNDYVEISHEKFDNQNDIKIVDTNENTQGSLADILSKFCFGNNSKSNYFTELYYSDRYIRSEKHINTLIDLIIGLPKKENFRAVICTNKILKSSNHPQAQELTPDNQAQKYREISEKIKSPNINFKLSMYITSKTNQDTRNFPGFQHKREIQLVDDQKKVYKFYLDPGLDIYSADSKKFNVGFIGYYGEVKDPSDKLEVRIQKISGKLGVLVKVV